MQELPKQFHFILDICSSQSTELLTKHNVPFPQTVKLRTSGYNQFVFQLTPYNDNKNLHAPVFSLVDYFEIHDNSIEIHVITTSKNMWVGWNINIEAYLTVSILNSEVKHCPKKWAEFYKCSIEAGKEYEATINEYLKSKRIKDFSKYEKVVKNHDFRLPQLS